MLHRNPLAWLRSCRVLLAIVLALSLPSIASAWTISARELVDVEFATDDALMVLVSAPGSDEPGLYRWSQGSNRIQLVCRIASPAMFSFDRKTIIERVRGDSSQLNFYATDTCARIGTLPIEGRLLDADVRGHQVAVALRTSANDLLIRLFRLPGELIAETAVGRNIEMGFAPDGRSLVNFDVSDGGQALWRWPDLQREALPSWSAEGELTFVAGADFVKHYSEQTLTVARWPDGKPLYAIPATRGMRLRELSASGRYGVLQHRSGGIETLEWVDFAVSQRRVMAHRSNGSIDHAAIDATGKHVAWTERSGDKPNQVTVFRTTVDVSTPAPPSTRQ